MRSAAPNLWLIAAGWGSVVASLAHLVCIIGGPNWYRFMGAGERIARAAERGEWLPTILTLAIAAVIAGWAAYAFSAAGIIIRLPLTRTALVLISLVLLLRACAYFVGPMWRPDLSHGFMMWSSLIVFVLGLCFAIGTTKAWPIVSERSV